MGWDGMDGVDEWGMKEWAGCFEGSSNAIHGSCKTGKCDIIAVVQNLRAFV